MRQGPSGGRTPEAGIQGTVGGGDAPGSGGIEGSTPGRPAGPRGGVTLPPGGPQAPSRRAGSGLTARSAITNSGATSDEAGCPVSLQSVVGTTSAGRAQSAGFLPA